MSDIRLVIAWISAGLYFAATVPYILKAYKNVIHPQTASWAIWTFVALILVTSSRQSNAFWLYLVQLICCALVFGFSLKNGLGGFSKTDKLCIFLCIIALAFKVVVGSGIVAIILASFVECTAFYLSFTKLLKHPGGEYQLQWLLSTVTGLLAFMSLKSFSVSFSLYPIIITMGNAAVTALIYTQNSNVPITLDNGSV